MGALLADFMLGRLLVVVAASALLLSSLSLNQRSNAEREREELRAVLDGIASVISSCGLTGGEVSLTLQIEEPAGAEIELSGRAEGGLQRLSLVARKSVEVTTELLLPVSFNEGDFRISASLPCELIVRSSSDKISLQVV